MGYGLSMRMPYVEDVRCFRFMIRPLSNMPYQSMHHEDNDWYVRLAAAWAHITPLLNTTTA